LATRAALDASTRVGGDGKSDSFSCAITPVVLVAGRFTGKFLQHPDSIIGILGRVRNFVCEAVLIFAAVAAG
jgi:hypothetical protein